MTDADLVKTSKFLSLVLRHQPEKIGLSLDSEGWAEVDELITKAQTAGVALDQETLDRVVMTSEKQRFRFSEDRRRIRANQGHSINVDLGLRPVKPPEMLFHGTSMRFLEAIRREGLLPGSRQHVHVSGDRATATVVGQRHGKPVVLDVYAGALHRSGVSFYRSDNGVWLVDHVPPRFLDFGELRYRRCSLDEVLTLRHAELRPGFPIDTAHFDGDDEATTLHFGAFGDSGANLGCASFMLNTWQDEPAYQLRGMATRADRAGQGIGAALLAHAIAELQRHTDVRRVWGNARNNAIGFYVKQGWTIASDEFNIPGVGPHFKITRDL